MIAKLPMPAAVASRLRRVSPFRFMLPPSLRASLPVAVNLVPFVKPFPLQLHELIVLRHPDFHDVWIEALGVERRFLERGQVADLADHRGLPLFGEAPVEEKLRGIGMRGSLRNARRER